MSILRGVTGCAIAVASAFVVAVAPVGSALAAGSIGFGTTSLTGADVTNPTSLQFGPDGRLYVAQQDGLIHVFTVRRDASDDYVVTSSETIDLVQQIPNHDDDGTPNSTVQRQVTGLLVVGTAERPVLYVTSSDWRIFVAFDSGLDTNSGTLSRLTFENGVWNHVVLVRGLPRSEENHSTNGMQLDPATNTLFVAQGGNTNMGAPSVNFSDTPEYALSAAILEIDLGMIGNTTYDLPTLDDPSRPNTGPGGADQNDPFGGNDGENQAVIDPGGPVQVYAPGFRNPYDLLITRSGRMYTVDNGPNDGWGGPPISNGNACTNQLNEADSLRHGDSLHLITGRGHYGGHPNPTRASRTNQFSGQSPVPGDNLVECEYRMPDTNGSLHAWTPSTNGIAEYTASNFDGAMCGDLVTASFNNSISRVVLNETGDVATEVETILFSFGGRALDVIAQPDEGPFPGTLWVADHQASLIVIHEPDDYGTPLSVVASTSAIEFAPTEIGAEAVASWETGPPLPIALGEVAATIIGDTLFVVGEGDAATLGYDLVDGTWSSTFDVREFTGHHHAAEVLADQMHLLGGLGGAAGRHQVYDPIADDWSLLPNMIYSAGSVSSAVINGQIYVCGGIAGGVTVNNAARFDPVANQWYAITPMPQGRNHAAAESDGRKLYVFGGRGAGSGDGNVVANGFANVQVYDPETDTWEDSDDPGSDLAPLPQARGGTGTAVFANGEFYVIGGETQDGPGAEPGNVYNRVDVYNPVTNTWRLDVPMPTPRHGVYPVLHEGRIHVPGGGTNAGNSQTDVYEILRSAPVMLTLTNTGAALQTVESVTIQGPHAGDFELAKIAIPLALSPGESVTVEVRFLPMSNGPRTADLVIDVAEIDCTLGVSLAGVGLCANQCDYDLGSDCSVGFADLLELIGDWGPCAGCPADLTGSGSVGFEDLGLLLNAWGPC